MPVKAKTMQDEKQLPADFDGVYRFTNFTDRPFKAKWNNVEYTFPAQKMTPIIIPNASALEIQAIRKKFARDLAIEEFYRSDKFKGMDDPKNHNGRPAMYTDSDLTPFVQRCLEALPVAQATMTTLARDNEANYTSRVLNEKESLVKESGVPIA